MPAYTHVSKLGKNARIRAVTLKLAVIRSHIRSS